MIALFAQFLDFNEHSFQQSFGRARGYPGPLELPDLAPLPMHLRTSTLDLTPNMVDVRHGRPFAVVRPLEQTKNRFASRYV